MSSLPKEKGEKKKESNEKPKESGEKSKESGEKPKESGEKAKESGEKPKESDEKAEEKEEEYIGYFERPKVLSRFEYGKKLELIELEGCEKVNGSILIEGFAGVGTTSTVVASYLIGERNLPLIAVFHSVELPSLCSIHKYQATSALRIYGDSTMCVCVGDIQLSAVTQSELIWTISEAVISFAHRHKCKHIISVDGFPIRSGIDRLKSMVQKAQNADSLEDQILQDDDSKQLDNLFSKVGYLSNNKQIGTQLKQLGHKAIKTGQIIGVSGALLALAFTYGQDECPLTVILAPDPVQLPDQRGALLAIKLIRQLFSLDDIKVEALEEDAKRLAIKIEEAIKDAQSQISRQFQHHIRSPPPPGMYS